MTVLAGVAALIAAAVLLIASAHARGAEYPRANAMTARAVAGYLSVVAPVDQRGSDFDLVALLSAVYTLRTAPQWRRGLQVAWGNAPILPDSLGLTPVDSLTRRRLTDSGTAFANRSGRAVALVPLLDRDLRTSIGWVAVWGSLAPERGRGLSLTFFLTMMAAATLIILLPPSILRSRARIWLLLISIAGAALFALEERTRVNSLASRRETMVLSRVQHLVGRASTMPRISENQLVRIAPDWQATIRKPGDSSAAAALRIPLRSGSVLEISLPAPVLERTKFEKTMIAGVAVFGLMVGLGAWARGSERTANRS